MIKLLNLLVDTTPGLNYHLKHGIPLSENIYRYSSDGFLQLFAEARNLHRDGYLQLCEADRLLLEETNIGEFGSFQGKTVPLDMPMIEIGEEIICRKCKHRWEVTPEDTHPALCHRCGYDNVRGIYDKQALENWKAQTDETNTRFPRAGEQGGYVKRNMTVTDKNNNQLRVTDITSNKIVLKPTGYSGQVLVFPDNYDQFAKIEQFWDYFNLDKIVEARYQGDYNSLEDEIANKEFGMDYNQLGPNEKQWVKDEIENLSEAKHKGQDVQLNKPKRGGPKKFYVYVKDPKTKNIKKVNFGDSGNLTVKLNEPGARAAFAARHKCAMKKDRTSPGYWSCNIGRYWKSLGGSKNFSGYW